MMDHHGGAVAEHNDDYDDKQISAVDGRDKENSSEDNDNNDKICNDNDDDVDDDYDKDKDDSSDNDADISYVTSTEDEADNYFNYEHDYDEYYEEDEGRAEQIKGVETQQQAASSTKSIGTSKAKETDEQDSSLIAKTWRFVDQLVDICNKKNKKDDDDDNNDSSSSSRTNEDHKLLDSQTTTTTTAAADGTAEEEETASELLLDHQQRQEEQKETPPGGDDVDIEIESVAIHDLVFLTQRMLLTQDMFRQHNKPVYDIDIGYHYTTEENLVSIRSNGLLTKADREANNIIASRYNGSSYGDGIYTASDPYSHHNFGPIGLIVARLRGIRHNGPPKRLGGGGGRRFIFTRSSNNNNFTSQTSADDIDNHDSIIINCGTTTTTSRQVVVLGSSCQCLPLARFTKNWLDTDDFDRRKKGNDILYEYHCKLQTLLDDFLNNGIEYNDVPTKPSVPSRCSAPRRPLVGGVGSGTTLRGESKRNKDFIDKVMNIRHKISMQYFESGNDYEHLVKRIQTKMDTTTAFTGTTSRRAIARQPPPNTNIERILMGWIDRLQFLRKRQIPVQQQQLQQQHFQKQQQQQQHYQKPPESQSQLRPPSQPGPKNEVLKTTASDQNISSSSPSSSSSLPATPGCRVDLGYLYMTTNDEIVTSLGTSNNTRAVVSTSFSSVLSLLPSSVCELLTSSSNAVYTTTNLCPSVFFSSSSASPSDSTATNSVDAVYIVLRLLGEEKDGQQKPSSPIPQKPKTATAMPSTSSSSSSSTTTTMLLESYIFDKNTDDEIVILKRDQCIPLLAFNVPSYTNQYKTVGMNTIRNCYTELEMIINEFFDQ